MKKEIIETDWHKFENEAKAEGFSVVCGVDEAGRGPLGEMNFRGIFDFRTRPYPYYFENVIQYVKNLLGELDHFELDLFYKRQISLNVRMVIFSASFAKIRLGEIPSADGIRALIAEADAIEKEFLLLWNAENYEHGSDEFLSQLRGRREELCTLYNEK